MPVKVYTGRDLVARAGGDERKQCSSFCGLSCGLKLCEPIIPKWFGKNGGGDETRNLNLDVQRAMGKILTTYPFGAATGSEKSKVC